MDWAKTTARRDEKHLSFGIWCVLYWGVDGIEKCFKLMRLFLKKSPTWWLSSSTLHKHFGLPTSVLMDNTWHILRYSISWWCHQIEGFSALLALCERISPMTGEFPVQRRVTCSFAAFFICTWTNGSVNNQDTGDLRRHRPHYDVTVMVNDIEIHCKRSILCLKLHLMIHQTSVNTTIIQRLSSISISDCDMCVCHSLMTMAQFH